MLTPRGCSHANRDALKVQPSSKKLEFWNFARNSLIYKAFLGSNPWNFFGTWNNYAQTDWNKFVRGFARFQNSNTVPTRLESDWNFGIISLPRETLFKTLAHARAGTYNWLQPKQKNPTNLSASRVGLIKHYLIDFRKASIATLVLTSSAVASPLAFAFLHLVLIVSITLVT